MSHNVVSMKCNIPLQYIEYESNFLKKYFLKFSHNLGDFMHIFLTCNWWYERRDTAYIVSTFFLLHDEKKQHASKLLVHAGLTMIILLCRLNCEGMVIHVYIPPIVIVGGVRD